jgi:hypothetical protein
MVEGAGGVSPTMEVRQVLSEDKDNTAGHIIADRCEEGILGS